MFSQLPIDSPIMSKFIAALELPYPLLPLAMKSNSQLLALSGGEAELVKVSEMEFKLGDVPCIFGEYKVDWEAILLGDPIPESTEWGWILFWPATPALPLDSCPLIEPGRDERTVEFPWFKIGPGWFTDCCPFIPFPDGLRTGVTIADPLLASVVTHELFAEIVAADDTDGLWLWCWSVPLFPDSFDSIIETGKLAGGWNACEEDEDEVVTLRCSMDPGELSSSLPGESHIFDDGVLHVGFAWTEDDGVLTSVHAEFWELDTVVILEIEGEHEVVHVLLEFGDMDGIL